MVTSPRSANRSSDRRGDPCVEDTGDDKKEEELFDGEVLHGEETPRIGVEIAERRKVVGRRHGIRYHWGESALNLRSLLKDGARKSLQTHDETVVSLVALARTRVFGDFRCGFVRLLERGVQLPVFFAAPDERIRQTPFRTRSNRSSFCRTCRTLASTWWLPWVFGSFLRTAAYSIWRLTLPPRPRRASKTMARQEG